MSYPSGVPQGTTAKFQDFQIRERDGEIPGIFGNPWDLTPSRIPNWEGLKFDREVGEPTVPLHLRQKIDRFPRPHVFHARFSKACVSSISRASEHNPLGRTVRGIRIDVRSE